MSRVTVKCAWCGKEISRYPSKVTGTNFCCRACMNKFASKKHNPEGYRYRDFSKNSVRFSEMNTELNPTRMTPEVRGKLRQARLGAGQGRTYEKTYGRHTHRVVAEEMLGRPLLPGEVVHHVDGDKRNNMPANLIVFPSQEEHAAWHVKYEKLFYGTVLGQEVTPE